MTKMADNPEEYITLVDEDGNEELYRILFTFDSDDFDKNYVLLYPTAANEDEEVEIFAFSYENPDEDLEGQLDNIETDEEWEMIEEVLGAFIEEEDL